MNRAPRENPTAVNTTADTATVIPTAAPVDKEGSGAPIYRLGKT